MQNEIPCHVDWWREKLGPESPLICASCGHLYLCKLVVKHYKSERCKHTRCKAQGGELGLSVNCEGVYNRISQLWFTNLRGKAIGIFSI